MAQNTSPIFGLTPRIGTANITTTAASTRSDGVGTVGTNIFLTFTAGPSGSFIQKVRFFSVASAPTTGVATVLRTFWGTVGTGTLTAADAALLGEISVGALATANATNATNFYELPLNFAIPANTFILVSQHTAQTTNQNWTSMVIASDY